MHIGRLISTSFAVGLSSILLWVAIWGIAFPDVWSGYGDYVMWVFGLSSITVFVYGATRK